MTVNRDIVKTVWKERTSYFENKIPVKKGHYVSGDTQRLRYSGIDEQIRKFEILRKPLKYYTADFIERQKLHYVIWRIRYVKRDEFPSYRRYQSRRNDNVDQDLRKPNVGRLETLRETKRRKNTLGELCKTRMGIRRTVTGVKATAAFMGFDEFVAWRSLYMNIVSFPYFIIFACFEYIRGYNPPSPAISDHQR